MQGEKTGKTTDKTGDLAAKAKKHLYGNTQKAIELYNQAISAGEPDHNLLNELADAYNRLGDYGKALEYGKKALEKKPDYPWTLDTLATTYAGLEEYEAAEAYYQKAITLKRDYAVAYWNLASLYAENDQLLKAEKTMQEALKNCDEKGELYSQLGDIYYQGHKPLRALEAYHQSLRIKKKERSPTLVKMARCYWEKLNDNDSAIRYLHAAADEQYRNPETHYLLYQNLKEKWLDSDQTKTQAQANNLYRRSVQELGLAIAFEKDFYGHRHFAKELASTMGLRPDKEEDAEKISRYIR
jgi:tetratricopeptide (TPR) repeat protein